MILIFFWALLLPLACSKILLGLGATMFVSKRWWFRNCSTSFIINIKFLLLALFYIFRSYALSSLWFWHISLIGVTPLPATWQRVQQDRLPERGTKRYILLAQSEKCGENGWSLDVERPKSKDVTKVHALGRWILETTAHRVSATLRLVGVGWLKEIDGGPLEWGGDCGDECLVPLGPHGLDTEPTLNFLEKRWGKFTP